MMCQSRTTNYWNDAQNLGDTHIMYK